MDVLTLLSLDHLLLQCDSDNCCPELNVLIVGVELKIFDDLLCRSLL